MTVDVDGLARLMWVQLWQITIVALGIGAFTKVFCRDRPRLAYALWMLVVVKSIVPPVWSSPAGLFSWVMAESAAARAGFTEVPPDLSNASPVAASGAGRPAKGPDDIVAKFARDPGMDRATLRLIIISVWAVGLVLCTAYVLAKQIVCSILIRRSRLHVDERFVSTLTELSRRLRVRRHVRLIVTSRPIGPAVFGLIRPSVLMPAALLCDSSPQQVELVLAHELVHVRRGDIIAGKLQLIAQLVWWFYPMVWWANREACRERERCCDEDVVSGVGCKPVLYARTLLNVLEQKKRLRSLVALAGMRALEVTSLRLESIMRYAGTDHRRASRISRLVFAAGLVLLVPGTGLALRARSPVKDDADVTIAAVSAQTTARTLRGVVREKGTGRPVAGALVYVRAVSDEAGGWPSRAVTDEAGRYTITDLPMAREYALTPVPKPGEPFLRTSRKVETAGDQAPLTADVEVVRGIPFRVRVLDRETGKPLKGCLSYFPIHPNNPFERGVMGAVGAASKGSAVIAAFCEAIPDDQGQFHGAVLSGPGLLGFSHPYRPGDEFRADRNPMVSFPDGKQNIKLPPPSNTGAYAMVPISSDPLRWTGLPLGQYDAVIVIDPREGAEVATYEIRTPPAAQPKKAKKPYKLPSMNIERRGFTGQ